MLDRIGCTRFKAEFDHHEPCRFCFVVIIYSSFKSVLCLSFLAFSKVISIFGKGKFCFKEHQKELKFLLGLVTRDSFAVHLWSSNSVGVLAIKNQFPIKKQKQRPYTYVYIYIYIYIYTVLNG